MVFCCSCLRQDDPVSPNDRTYKNIVKNGIFQADKSKSEGEDGKGGGLQGKGRGRFAGIRGEGRRTVRELRPAEPLPNRTVRDFAEPFAGGGGTGISSVPTRDGRSAAGGGGERHALAARKLFSGRSLRSARMFAKTAGLRARRLRPADPRRDRYPRCNRLRPRERRLRPADIYNVESKARRLPRQAPIFNF